jgi:hypothetical protein
MVPPGDLKPMQVRLPAEVLEAFKRYAEREDRSMASLVAGWIEGAIAGRVAAPEQGRGVSAAEHQALVERVSALEQALIAVQATPPHGGTGARRASESASEGVSRVPEFKRPTPEELGYRAVREEELLPGLKVWVKKWGREGEVTEAPTMGVALVKGLGSTRMAEGVQVEQLFIAAPPVAE